MKGILILFVVLSHSYPAEIYQQFFTPLFLIYVFLCVRIFFLKERFFWCVSEKQAVSTDTSIIAFGGGLECWFPMCWKAMT